MKRLYTRDVTSGHEHHQGWTGQEMTHKQDVCQKSRSSLEESPWGLSMYNVNTRPRTKPLVMGVPMPQTRNKNS